VRVSRFRVHVSKAEALIQRYPEPYRSILVFGQPCEARLRFLDGWGIANIHSLCDDACGMPDSASFCSGPGQGINWPVCLEEVSMTGLAAASSGRRQNPK